MMRSNSALTGPACENKNKKIQVLPNDRHLCPFYKHHPLPNNKQPKRIILIINRSVNIFVFQMRSNILRSRIIAMYVGWRCQIILEIKEHGTF